MGAVLVIFNRLATKEYASAYWRPRGGHMPVFDLNPFEPVTFVMKYFLVFHLAGRTEVCFKFIH